MSRRVRTSSLPSPLWFSSLQLARMRRNPRRLVRARISFCRNTKPKSSVIWIGCFSAERFTDRGRFRN
jgi:hypothetical protein